MNAILKNRLAQYGAFAAIGTLPSGKIAAQEVYTDIEPDLFLYRNGEWWGSEPEMQFIDLDDDGIVDVGLDFNTFYACGYCPVYSFFHIELNENVQVPTVLAPACYLTSSFYGEACTFAAANVLQVLGEGAVLSEDLAWGAIDELILSHHCGAYGEWCTQGDFNPYAVKSFITVRKIDTDTSYCWLRLTYSDDSMFVRDFACSTEPVFEIHDKVADPALNLMVTQDACTGGTDEIRVRFDPALDESSVSEYRIMVAPTIDFNPDAALLVSPENYVSVTPNGLHVDLHLPPDFHNYTGDPILANTDFKVSVFSIYHDPESNTSSQVWSAPVRYATTGFAEAPDVTDLEMDPEHFSSADFSVYLSSEVDTAKTISLRLMFLPSEERPDFTVDMARAASNYIEIDPNPTLPVSIPEHMRTYNGDLMLPEVYYRAIVLAMPKTPDYCVSVLGKFSGASEFQAPGAVPDPQPSIFVYYDQQAIHIENPEQFALSLLVYDLNGQKIYTAQINESNTQIPFTFPTGIYIAQINNALTSQVIKFICD